MKDVNTTTNFLNRVHFVSLVTDRVIMNLQSKLNGNDTVSNCKIFNFIHIEVEHFFLVVT